MLVYIWGKVEVLFKTKIYSVKPGLPADIYKPLKKIIRIFSIHLDIFLLFKNYFYFYLF